MISAGKIRLRPLRRLVGDRTVGTTSVARGRSERRPIETQPSGPHLHRSEIQECSVYGRAPGFNDPVRPGPVHRGRSPSENRHRRVSSIAPIALARRRVAERKGEYRHRRRSPREWRLFGSEVMHTARGRCVAQTDCPPHRWSSTVKNHQHSVTIRCFRNEGAVGDESAAVLVWEFAARIDGPRRSVLPLRG